MKSGFAPANLTEAVTFSEMLAKSSMVPKGYQGKPEDILVAVQWGYELGLAPMQALQNIAVINGKPSVYGDAALALCQVHPHCEGIHETIEGEGTENPVAVCTVKRKNREPVVCRFSVQDAKRANLWGKQGPWTQYPKRMLQMRARGFALRDAFPDALKGLVTIEEAQDYPSEAFRSSERDIRAQEAPVALIESQDLSKLKYKLMLPGNQVYSAHETADEYISEYGILVQRIWNSTKYDKDDKVLKINDLREANTESRRLLDPVQTLRLSAACAAPQQTDFDGGGQANPKKSDHQEKPPNESEFSSI
jgi:hypothetical protein